MSSGNIFYYFVTKDEIIVRSTAYCMEKVEEDFMKNAPKNAEDISRFLKEVPFWTTIKTRTNQSPPTATVQPRDEPEPFQ